LIRQHYPTPNRHFADDYSFRKQSYNFSRFDPGKQIMNFNKSLCATVSATLMRRPATKLIKRLKDFYFVKRLFTSNSWQRTLYIMLFAQFVSAIGFSMIFPFLPLYIQALGTNSSLSLEFWMGMVFTSQGLTMMVASPIWGAMADRFGRKIMVERAMFGGAVLLFLMGFVRSAEELVLIRAIQGLVTGTVPAANALVAATAPRERSGYAMGALQMGFWSGLALGPLIGGFIADTWGFRAAFIVTGVLLATAGLVVWLGIDEVFEPAATKKQAFAFMTQWQSILSAPGVGLIYTLRAMSWLGRMTLVPVIPLFIQSLLPESARVSTFTGLVVGVAAATGTLSAIYLGRLGDRIGHRRVLYVSALTAGLFYLPQAYVTAGWQLLILQALVGAAIGGVIPAISALLSNFTRPGQEGAVYGLDSSVAAGARAVAPLIGAGVALWFGMPATFFVAGILFSLTAILAIFWLPERRAISQPQAI
jgi:DHA1 family multidrug resistance protein-like MFS transporter